MTFSPKNKENPDLSLNIGGSPIEKVTDFNFLGITIDEGITWKKHIDKITLKLSRINGVFNRLKNFLPPEILKLLYYSMFMCHMNYGSLVWGFSNHADKIDKVQKKTIRNIANAKYNAHVGPLCKELNILRFSENIKVNALKFFCKWESNLLPKYFSSLVNQTPDSHDYNMRQNVRPRFKTETPRLAMISHSLRYQMPIILNGIDQEILVVRHNVSILTTVQKYKICLMQAYPDKCLIKNCYICNRTT